ncbi:MFS transporter [Streptomyces sp. NPDC058401]|uniref:MFS transporter n=1 Tax=Streptomyces sp. NPDC058401 TaxID=3346480 RepID=UPI00365D22DD
MLVALDGTVLLMAQPSLRRDLGASMAEVQWTSGAYLLSVAAFLVLAGRLGDRYGHTRLLFTGVLGFAAASAGIALAPGAGWVIALRAAQGLFGALLQPATLALLRLAYPPARIGGAVAVRTAAIGLAAAAGPLLGGVLVERFGWRAVFAANVPAALAIAAAALFVRVPAPPPTEPGGRIRPGGAALLATALAALVHALAGVPEHGWSGPRTLAAFAAAAALAALLVRSERRSAQPLVPRPVARSVPVTASVALLALVSAALFGALFGASFALQDAAGLDPVATGLRVLPMTAAMVLGAPVAGALLRRFGARGTAMAGTGLVALGITGLGPGWGFGVLGAGFAAVMVTATGTVVGDAPAGHAGVVGGLKQTAMNVGPALGIAVAAGTGASPLALAALAAVGLLPASRLPASRLPAPLPSVPLPSAPLPPAPLPSASRPARGGGRAGRAAARHLVGEGAGERGEGGPAPDGPADGERRQGGDRHQAQRSG